MVESVVMESYCLQPSTDSGTGTTDVDFERAGDDVFFTWSRSPCPCHTTIVGCPWAWLRTDATLRVLPQSVEFGIADAGFLTAPEPCDVTTASTRRRSVGRTLGAGAWTWAALAVSRSLSTRWFIERRRDARAHSCSRLTRTARAADARHARRARNGRNVPPTSRYRPSLPTSASLPIRTRDRTDFDYTRLSFIPYIVCFSRLTPLDYNQQHNIVLCGYCGVDIYPMYCYTVIR